MFCFPCNVPQQWHHELGSCVDVISSRRQKVFVGVDVRFAVLLTLFSIRRYCWIEAARINITRTLTRDRFHQLACNPLHKDDSRVPISSTLVELVLTEAVLGERLNSNLLISVVVFA